MPLWDRCRSRAGLPLVLALLGATAARLAAAQGLPEAEPEAVGLSSARLERVDRRIEQAIADDEMVGAVALIARHGKVAYLKPIGIGELSIGPGRKFGLGFAIVDDPSLAGDSSSPGTYY